MDDQQWTLAAALLVSNACSASKKGSQSGNLSLLTASPDAHGITTAAPKLALKRYWKVSKEGMRERESMNGCMLSH